MQLPIRCLTAECLVTSSMMAYCHFSKTYPRKWGRRGHPGLSSAVGAMRGGPPGDPALVHATHIARHLPLYHAAGADTVRYRTERPPESGYPSSRVNSSLTTW